MGMHMSRICIFSRLHKTHGISACSGYFLIDTPLVSYRRIYPRIIRVCVDHGPYIFSVIFWGNHQAYDYSLASLKRISIFTSWLYSFRIFSRTWIYLFRKFAVFFFWSSNGDRIIFSLYFFIFCTFTRSNDMYLGMVESVVISTSLSSVCMNIFDRISSRYRFTRDV